MNELANGGWFDEPSKERWMGWLRLEGVSKLKSMLMIVLTLSLDNVSGLLKARRLMSEEEMDRGHGLRALRAF